MCTCDWVTLLYSRKLTEHAKPAIMEKNKNHLKKKEKENPVLLSTVQFSKCKAKIEGTKEFES